MENNNVLTHDVRNIKSRTRQREHVGFKMRFKDVFWFSFSEIVGGCCRTEHHQQLDNSLYSQRSWRPAASQNILWNEQIRLILNNIMCKVDFCTCFPLLIIFTYAPSYLQWYHHLPVFYCPYTHALLLCTILEGNQLFSWGCLTLGCGLVAVPEAVWAVSVPVSLQSDTLNNVYCNNNWLIGFESTLRLW